MGVHGDGEPGLELEDLERLAGARIAAARGEARGGEADPVADGVRDVPRGVHGDAVSGRARWTPIGVPAAVVGPVARRLPPRGRAAARELAVLRAGSLKSGSGCPDPSWPSNRERVR